MLVVNEWFGRCGNNVLQLVRGIYLAKHLGHSSITFPNHWMFNTTTVQVSPQQEYDPPAVSDIFFYLSKFGLKDPSPEYMKQICKQYIISICTIHLPSSTPDTLFIHIRGGDIFSSNPHSWYVQPPISFYTKCMADYSRVVVVSEDTSNPCVSRLCSDPRVEFKLSSLQTDIETLLSSESLAIGFGTFGFMIYLLSNNLKTLYIPEYALHELPSGPWGGDIVVHPIQFPNYIPIGEWKNTAEQRERMLTYV